MTGPSADYVLLDKIAHDAYMEVMGGTAGVLGIIANRENVPLSVLTNLTPDEVGEMYDFQTRPVLGKELDHTMVLVGECGGLSAIFEVEPSASIPGMVRVETEHGPLYLDPDEEQVVLGQ